MTDWRDSKVRMAIGIFDIVVRTNYSARYSSSGSELQVRTPNCAALDAASENPKELTVSLGPDEVSFSEFVRQGWRRENLRPGASEEAVAAEGWTSKSAPAMRFRPAEYFDSR